MRLGVAVVLALVASLLASLLVANAAHAQSVDVPGPPRNVIATAGTGKVQLTWDAPSTTGGADLTGYEYRRKEDDGSWGAWASVEATATEFLSTLTSLDNATTLTDYDVNGDTEYAYEVRALNSAGEGPGAGSGAVTTGAPITLRIEVPEVHEDDGEFSVSLVAEMPYEGPNELTYDRPFEVIVTTDSGTAVVGHDYLVDGDPGQTSEGTGFIWFFPRDFQRDSGLWVARKTEEITAIDNDDAEADKMFTVNIEKSDPDFPAFVKVPGDSSSAAVTILNDDEPDITLTLMLNGDETNSLTTGEADGDVTVGLLAKTAGEVRPVEDFEVSFGSIEGTATSGQDYNAPDLVFSFEAAEFTLENGRFVYTVEREIEIVDDNQVERTQYITVTFDTNDKPAHVAKPSGLNFMDAFAININDNDNATLRITQYPTQVEEGDDIEVTLELDPPAGGVFTVDVELTGSIGNNAVSDRARRAQFAAGEAQQTVKWETEEDGTVEDDETFTIEFTAIDSALMSAVTVDNSPAPMLTITDDDHAPKILATELVVRLGVTEVGRLGVRDPDTDRFDDGEKHHWELTDSDDQALFTLADNGLLALKSAATSVDEAGADGEYRLTVKVIDPGGNTDTADITVKLQSMTEPSVPGWLRWERTADIGADRTYSVMLMWDEPADGGNDPVLHYQYRAGAGQWQTVAGGAAVREYMLPELECGERYIYSLRAVNGTGAGPSRTRNVTVLCGAPGAPQDLTAERISESYVRLSWERPDLGSGSDIEIVGYRFEISPNGDDWNNFRDGDLNLGDLSFILNSADEAHQMQTLGMSELGEHRFVLSDPTPSLLVCLGPDASLGGLPLAHIPSQDRDNDARWYRVSALYGLTGSERGFHSPPSESVKVVSVSEEEESALPAMAAPDTGPLSADSSEEPDQPDTAPDTGPLSADSSEEPDQPDTAPDTGPLSGFSLVETSESPGVADKEVTALHHDATVTLSDLSSNYAIRVDTSTNDDIARVELDLGGAKNADATERYAPYSLYGDNGPGDLAGENLPAGDYTLTAVAYDKHGDVLGSLSMSFTVLGLAVHDPDNSADHIASDQADTAPDTGPLNADSSEEPDQPDTAPDTGPLNADSSEEPDQPDTAPDTGPLSGFSLVETSESPGVADKEVTALHHDATVTLSDLSSNYAIRVDTSTNDDIARVELDLGGAKNADATERYAPYSLYGDNGPGDLAGENLPAGDYTLTAVAYDKHGDVLGTLSVSFTVLGLDALDPDNSAPDTGPLNADTSEEPEEPDTAPDTGPLNADTSDDTAEEPDQADTAPPARPGDLQGHNTAQGIALSWSAPTGPPASRYVIYRAELHDGRLDGRPLNIIATIDATSTPAHYTDTDITAGTQYRYRIAAINDAGEGKKSVRLDIQRQ